MASILLLDDVTSHASCGFLAEIDECESDPCINGDCEDQVNGFLCHCLPGWTGQHCEIGQSADSTVFLPLD